MAKKKPATKPKLITAPKKTKAVDKEIVPVETKKNLPAMEKKKIEDWLTMTGKVKELTPGEVGQFIEIASAFGLNPFKREIHVSVYSKDDPKKRTLTIVIGYEVYLKRAERLNNLDGWKCWTEGEGQKLIAHIQIWRKDRHQPFEWKVTYREAVQTKYDGSPNHFWAKMPAMMLKKVCISQGFRLCFPDDLGGIPYTDAEMGSGDYSELPKTEDVKSEQPLEGMDDGHGNIEPSNNPACPSCNSNAKVIISKYPNNGKYFCLPCKKGFNAQSQSAEPDENSMSKEEREMICRELSEDEIKAFRAEVLEAAKIGGDKTREVRKKYRELYKARITAKNASTEIDEYDDIPFN